MTQNNDQEKLKIAAALDKAYSSRVNNLKHSIELATEALVKSRQIEDEALTARSLSHLSLFSMIQGEYKQSIAEAEESIALFESIGDEKGVADAKYALAGTYYKTDDPNLGLIYLRDCLTTYKKFEDHHNIARVQKSMGSIYEYFGDAESAVFSYQKSIEAGIKAGDPNLESNTYNPLSGIYINQGKLKEAMSLIEKSISLKHQTSDTRGLAFALYGRAKVWAAMREYVMAEKDYLESIRIHRDMGEKLGQAMSYQKLSALYIEMDRLDEAREIIERELLIDNKYKIKLINFKSYYLMYQISKRKGDMEKALEFLELHLREKEAIVNGKAQKIIEGYEVIQKMKLQEKDNELLREKSDYAEKKNLELDSFFYRIYHDLKGHINSLESVDFLARDQLVDKSALSFFDQYAIKIKEIKSTLGDLVKIVRMNHRTEQLELIDFKKLINDILVFYRYLPKYDRITFKKDVAPDLHFSSEWALVSMIMHTLIKNAINYSRIDGDPMVEINISSLQKNIEIVVTDNGMGIDDKKKSALFEIFYKSGNLVEDTGMGLYMLNKALKKLGGTIELESLIDVGSKFTITLPNSGSNI
ncbi:MAG: tetratricopeptide repeat protein [Cyclobacteriaceae bacterium]|nr:tetratricopeptide repeat protein [Cyclobacteriaceae bacterium HetDA_MAG_MS6]